MKNTIAFCLFIIVVTLVTSCNDKDFLEVDNPNVPTTQSFWLTARDAQYGLSATYSALQLPYVLGGNGMMSREIITDLAYPNPFSQPLTALASFNWTSGDEAITSTWSQLYIGVFRANQVLFYVPSISMDSTQKVQILGQAHYLRAQFYFWLAISYNDGKIPLVVDVPLSPNQVYNKYATRAEVYDLIYKDLEAAQKMLPYSWVTAGNTTNLGRATWGAATALLGQIKLYEKQWSEAADYFKQVIDCNECGYRLVLNIGDNFNTAGEFNSESIFEVSFSAAVKEGTNANTIDGITGSEATNRARNFALSGRGQGLRNCTPHGFLSELIRKDTMDVSIPTNTGRLFSERALASICYRRDNMPYYGGVTADAAWAQIWWRAGWKKYTNYTLAQEDNILNRSGINERVMRLANVYLMYAEAITERDGIVSDEAVEYLNKVRRRSKVITYNTFNFPTKESFIDYLMWYERPRELCAEGFGIRWHDLRRRSLTKQALTNVATIRYINWDNENGTLTTNPQPIEITALANFNPALHSFFPIPSKELTSNIVL